MAPGESDVAAVERAAAVGSVSVLSRVEQADAAWLTDRLRDRRALPTGRVVAVETERWRSKPYSDLYRIRARYEGAADAAPRSFVLKLGDPAATNSVARRRRRLEHLFYAAVAPVMSDPPSPAAYSVAHDPDQGTFHLLMADLTESHARPPRGLPPTPEQAGRAVEALAALHAAWWNHPRAAEGLQRRDADWRRRKTESARDAVAGLLAAHGERLSPGTRAALEEVAAAYPTLIDPVDPFTVVHGDAHPWNALTPAAGEGPAVLVDWEGWSIDAPAGDLASFIALRFDPDLRRHAEDDLLRRYLAALRSRGVAGYDAAALGRDYRRAVARRVLSPAFAWRRGTDDASWWNNLSRITLAYHDLGRGEAPRG